MWRALLVLAIAAGVGSSEAAPAPSKASVKRSEKARSKTSVGASRLRSKASRHAKAKVVSRTPTRYSLSHTENMPRGYAWPPTRQMQAAEQACEAKLDDLGIEHQSAKPEGRIVDPLTIGQAGEEMTLGGVSYLAAFRQGRPKLDCQLALALEQFGGELQALGVRQVKFGSIYRFTNVRVGGKTKNILSRHALGIAMDIVSFIDEAGREVKVERDYPQADALLLDIERAVNASGRFRTLLTPKNDPISHADHFHLEVAVDYTAIP